MMKKMIMLALSVLFIVVSARAQVKLDNPLSVNLEVKVNGERLTLSAYQQNALFKSVKPGVLTKFHFRWLEKGKLVSQDIETAPRSHWALTSVELVTGQAIVETQELNTSYSQVSPEANEPGVGRVNFIKNVDSEISKFHLTIENNTSKDLIFIGDVFNGVALQPTNKAMSKTLVQPGLMEVTVLCQVSDSANTITSDQVTAFSQQALAFMVVGEDQIIHIQDDDLLDPTSMTDQKIRFENVGNVVLYPSSDNGRLKALRPHQRSKVIKIKDLKDLSWYYHDPGNNMKRVAIFEIVLGQTPIIKIRPMSNVYGAAKSKER